MSYPPPPPFTWPPIISHKLLPIFPPPEIIHKPSLPSHPRQLGFTAPYTLSTHLFPAAHLRTTGYVPPPPPLQYDPSKEKRRENAEKFMNILPNPSDSKVPQGSPQILWNCANRYVKKGLQAQENQIAPGVTMLFVHATGFPKEIWEPTLGYLLASKAASAIDEVWTWESVQHGDASLINRSKLGCVFDWTDNARDILNFLLYFLPSEAVDSSLPCHLARLPTIETEHRKVNSIGNRKLVVVGHSYGGCTSTLAALTSPKLFSSVILIDPVLAQPPPVLIDEPTTQLLLGALLRRETWQSREEALSLFQKSPFFGVWDPDVLRIYVECGTYRTRDLETGEAIIALKIPALQEAVVFRDCYTRAEVYHRVPELDPNIALRWIMPSKPGVDQFGPPGSAQQRVWLRPENSSNVRIPRAGHLIPHEQPKLLAADIEEFLFRTYIFTSTKL